MMNWHEWFCYNGINLIWKKSRGRMKAGSIAGCPNDTGRIRVRLFGRWYKAHRIIWEMHNGPIPEGYEIDHLDHDPSNNRLNNFRLVLGKENAKNRPKNKNNTSGYIGVYWDKERKKWYSQIWVNYKCITLGRFDRMEDAIKARQEAEIKYGFHPNHGK
ncbi:TPA: HNH endonuclease signature motif containing protein [Escherichia coli]